MTTDAYVHVRARTRFMVYGNTPARMQQTDVWVLSIPAAWATGETPGSCSPALTQRCGKAVAAQYADDRRKAFAAAQASAASGGDFDAGHYVMEGASIWVMTDNELKRRPWKGHNRFFYRLDDSGWRPCTDADVPQLPPLSPFEEAAFEGWRNEETGNWAGALKAHERALELSSDDIELVAEVLAGRVRAQGKMKRWDDAKASADDGIAKLGALGAPADAGAMIWIRLGECLIDAHPEAAGVAYDHALAVLSDDDPRVASLAQSAGLSALRQLQFDVARRRFERVVAAYEKKPPSPRDFASAHNNLALTLEHAGELQRAESHMRSAVQLHAQANNPAGVFDSKLGLARILARTGKPEARELLHELRPQVRAGSAVEGIVAWADALLAKARGADASAFYAIATQRLRSTPWAKWLESDQQ